MTIRILVFLFALSSCTTTGSDFTKSTPFEKSEGNESATYSKTIHYYKQLDSAFSQVHLTTYGKTDVGKPLHLIVLSNHSSLQATKNDQDQPVVLINNGIHPGEPCGIDASMMLARDIMNDHASLLKNLTVLIVPVYNTGGALNRGCCSRANQNGPKQYGFRGNARNLDLNRDFIKCDSRNVRAFCRLFHAWEPALFIDTHTSNGADHQQVMTYIASQKDKLFPALAEYQQNNMIPTLRKEMKKEGFHLVPYVYTRKDTPKSGLQAYMETGRYSTGYAALFNTMGFVTETHMLKPYQQRVQATYDFLFNTIQYISHHPDTLQQLKEQADHAVKKKSTFPVRWSLDTQSYTPILFNGYEADYKTSTVTGQPRLFYDHQSPYQDTIPYYDTYKPTYTASLPEAYLIPQAWREVIELLKMNQVNMQRLPHDTSLRTEVYYIKDFNTIEAPYEGHYLHYQTEVRRDTQQIDCYKGDYIIPTDQTRNKFLATVLEPGAQDSYFNWNFFDEILQQKEYFSSYVFDTKAQQILAQDSALRRKFKTKQLQDSVFRQNHRAQLRYIYRHSKYYEDSHRRYPVYRLFQNPL